MIRLEQPSLIRLRTLLFSTGLLLGVLPAWSAQEYNPVTHTPASVPHGGVQRLIIKFKSNATAASSGGNGESVAAANTAASRVQTLQQHSGITLNFLHPLTDGMHVVTLDHAMRGTELSQTLTTLRADTSVEYVVEDRFVRRHALASVPPNDPGYSTNFYAGSTQPVGQWHLKNTEASAINAEGAWALAQGSTSVVIADLDTGVRFDHPDLLRLAAGGRLLPGYDFVSADSPGVYTTANDGDGWDADPSDPGDWIDAALNATDSTCKIENSSWHGTRTAGIIGALTNNGTGIAGVDWNAHLLPVRVLGRCGGFSSDIQAAMLWAAGIAVSGAPANPNPARVINLSLGASGSCDSSYQDVVNQVIAKGVLVVASAGNETGAVASPANCSGVLAVGGLRHNGTKVGYSSFGSQVGISAPAGNCVNITAGTPCLYSIDTLTNDGTTVPANNTYTTQLEFNVGTSFSAPLASGVAGLMLSTNPTLTPAQIITMIKNSAKPFPTDPTLPTCSALTTANDANSGQCNCSISTCGAGMLNAKAAVQAAANSVAPKVSISAATQVNAGDSVTLDGSASTVTFTPATYLWTQTSGTTVTLFNASSATASFTAPTASSAGTVTLGFKLTVTDSNGNSTSQTANVGVATSATTTTTSSGGGGGGGAISVAELAALLLLLCASGVRGLKRLGTTSVNNGLQ